MRCAVSTCDKSEPRKGKDFTGFCIAHTFLFGMSNETRADFIARQEAQDRARKTRKEAA